MNNPPTQTSLAALKAENQKLREALKTVYHRSKTAQISIDELTQEKQKLQQTIHKQATTIPEYQLQNRVLQQQIKDIIKDMHAVETANTNIVEKVNTLKQKITKKQRALWVTRIVAAFLFAVLTAMIWLAYRDSTERTTIILTVRKLTNENEMLTQQNKQFFAERESFQETIQKKYQEQINLLNQKLLQAQQSEETAMTRYSTAIQSFKEQQETLEQEKTAILNLTRHQYESQIQDLINEKKILSTQLQENQIRNQEITLNDININEQKNQIKHNNFLKQMHEEQTKEESKKTKEAPTPPSEPSDAEFVIDLFHSNPLKRQPFPF